MIFMTDATTEFFQELAARGHEPALAKVTGTLRFDLAANLFEVAARARCFRPSVGLAAVE